MNSALNASAISRASVVLPTPGGPHRIIECSLPERERDRERLARREQVPLPDDVVDRARAQALGQRDAARAATLRCGEEVVQVRVALPDRVHYARYESRP